MTNTQKNNLSNKWNSSRKLFGSENTKANDSYNFIPYLK